MQTSNLKTRFGRPPVADRINVARDYLIRCLPASTVSRIYGCTERTVYNHVRAVLRSDDPGALTIQSLCRHRPR